MYATKMLYLEDLNILNCDANVLAILQENDNDIVILDQTVFYPQGGGQPYDQGEIKSANVSFNVTEVRLVDELIKHIGTFETKAFEKSEAVHCQVNEERRFLHSRIHSAGHLVDYAIQQLNLKWIPSKGFHFPSGPNVEYVGSLEGMDKEKLKTDIEVLCNQIIKENIKPQLQFVDRDKAASLCHFLPDYLPINKPVRLILFNDFAVPCGGTHVKNLADIRHLSIRKIKSEKGNIRVSYEV